MKNMRNELQVKVNQKLGIIDFNYEEMKQKLSEKMEEYNDIVVTADTRTIAKKDIASLRKIKKALNDRRIEVKKEYMAPYDEFDSKVKELTALIDEPIELIDKQVKAFEEKEKEEKKKEIEKLYNELIGDNEEYLPLEKIYNKRWENVSFSIKEIEKEIKESIDGVDLAVATIKGMNSEAEGKALELFKDDLSLSNAITYINQYEQQKAEIQAREEQRRKEEEERKRLEEIERVKEEERRKIAEIEKAKEEARQQAIEEEKRRKAEEQAREGIKEEVAEVTELAEEPFEQELPFIPEEPFDTDDDVEELPFSMIAKTVFTVYATESEMEKIDTYLKYLGVNYERADY